MACGFLVNAHQSKIQMAVLDAYVKLSMINFVAHVTALFDRVSYSLRQGFPICIDRGDTVHRSSPVVQFKISLSADGTCNDC